MVKWALVFTFTGGRHSCHQKRHCSGCIGAISALHNPETTLTEASTIVLADTGDAELQPDQTGTASSGAGVSKFSDRGGGVMGVPGLLPLGFLIFN